MFERKWNYSPPPFLLSSCHLLAGAAKFPKFTQEKRVNCDIFGNKIQGNLTESLKPLEQISICCDQVLKLQLALS